MHSLKDISFQSGVSLATVDRVLHGRDGVRQATRLRVEAAIRELDRQAVSASLDGKRVAIDVILEAPARFTKAVRAAFEAELEGLRPASMRLRFHIAEKFEETELLQLIRAIRRRGTHGIIAKIPDRPALIKEVQEVITSGIPLVTFVTDLPSSGRLDYIGMDNAAAGQIAAFLIGKSGARLEVLAIISSQDFDGEMRRLSAFKDSLKGAKIHVVQGAMGKDSETGRTVSKLIAQGNAPRVVYSAGGGNKAVLEALIEAGIKPDMFIAHDLDADNTALLKQGKIDVVIYHDLRQDARSCCQHILKALRLLPGEFEIPTSAIQLATPFNMP